MKSLKLGTETGSVVNWIMSSAADPTPAVGMLCTFMYWSDRSAAEIVTYDETTGVIGVRGLKATRTDNLGMSDSQSYRYEQQPEARVVEYARNRKGEWAPVKRYTKAGRPMTYKPSARLALGFADAYYDYSF